MHSEGVINLIGCYTLINLYFMLSSVVFFQHDTSHTKIFMFKNSLATTQAEYSNQKIKVPHLRMGATMRIWKYFKSVTTCASQTVIEVR